MKRLCLVRFDDLCPTMDMKSFDKAFKILDLCKSKPLLGVIPNNKDSDLFIGEMPDEYFWKYMKQLQNQGYDIAMHGYTHVYDQQSPKTIICGKKHSEFAGNSLQNQYEKIKRGKKILNDNGIYTDVFFAPAHTYDRNTLKALAMNGFKYLCDGYSNKPYKQCGIMCVPLSSLGKKGIHISVNHPNEWIRDGKKDDYLYLENYVKTNFECMCSFSDIKNVKCGWFPFEKIIEIIRIKFRPILTNIMKIIKNKK